MSTNVKMSKTLQCNKLFAKTVDVYSCSDVHVRFPIRAASTVKHFVAVNRFQIKELRSPRCVPRSAAIFALTCDSVEPDKEKLAVYMRVVSFLSFFGYSLVDHLFLFLPSLFLDRSGLFIS